MSSRTTNFRAICTFATATSELLPLVVVVARQLLINREAAWATSTSKERIVTFPCLLVEPSLLFAPATAPTGIQCQVGAARMETAL